MANILRYIHEKITRVFTVKMLLLIMEKSPEINSFLSLCNSYHYKVNLTLTACTRFRRLLARNCRKVKPRESLTRWKNLYHGTVYTTTFLRTYNVGYKDGNESKTHFFPPYPVTTHFSNDNFHFTIFFNRKWYSRSLLVVI